MDEKRKSNEDEKLEAFVGKWMNSLLTSLNDEDYYAAKKILKRCGKECAKSWYTLEYIAKHRYDMDSHDLSSFALALKKTLESEGGHSGGIRIEGDTAYVEMKQEGKCSCPLVMNGIVKLTPSLCACSTNYFEVILNEVTGKPVEVELIRSVARGDNDCIWKAEIQK